MHLQNNSNFLLSSLPFLENTLQKSIAAKTWVITIGNFDGFHLGHQTLLNTLIQAKQKFQAQSALISFYPHPKEILSNQPSSMIYDDAMKWKLCKAMGLDAGFIIPFTKSFSQISAEEFIEKYLLQFFQLKKIIVGHDFSFGKQRTGSTQLMQKLVQHKNIAFEQLPPYQIDKQIVSSTIIRNFLYAADFQTATRYLGRPWSITGEILPGQALGRQLGIPTINLYPKIQLPICNGVFICDVKINQKIYPAVVNVGENPTVSNNNYLKVEAHLLNTNKNFYHDEAEIIPHKLIRKEINFPNVEALKNQIQQDIQIATNYFYFIKNCTTKNNNLLGSMK